MPPRQVAPVPRHLDTLDPVLLDMLPVERERLLFDNRGVGSTRLSFSEMASQAIAFCEALGRARSISWAPRSAASPRRTWPSFGLASPDG